MGNLLTKIPWKTVGKVFGTAVTVGGAVWGALADQKRNQDFAVMKEKYEELSKALLEKQN